MRPRKETKLKKGPPDKTILLFAGFMTLFGVIMIFNASVYIAAQVFNDQFYFLKLQSIWTIISIGFGFIVYLVGYQRITKFILPILIINLVLLVLVLILGDEINGAKRWFEIGIIRVQPAEFIKPVLIVYLAMWLAKYKEIKDSSIAAIKSDAIKKIIGFLIILLFIAILVMLEPDMGTTMIICLTAIGMFYLSTTNVMQKVGTISVGIIGSFVSIIAIVIEPYRLARINTYIQLLLHGDVADPRGAGYQLHQILIGIGSSGFWGKGFGQSRQRFGYLVENTAFTDSTFAVVLEELGVLSAVMIIGLWLFFFFKGYQIAKNAPDKQSQLIAIGVTIWLTLQTLLNIAANIGIIPITGLPLPFFTYGGSSTIVTFVGIALLLNISRYSNNKEIKSSRNIYGRFR
jgi:cell division protein FtsW